MPARAGLIRFPLYDRRRCQQGLHNVFPTQDAFEGVLFRGDRQAGHFFLNHQFGGGLDGSGGGCRDRVPAHDLVRPFVEGSPISIGFRQGADVRTEGLQQVSIGNNAD